LSFGYYELVVLGGLVESWFSSGMPDAVGTLFSFSEKEGEAP